MIKLKRDGVLAKAFICHGCRMLSPPVTRQVFTTTRASPQHLLRQYHSSAPRYTQSTASSIQINTTTMEGQRTLPAWFARGGTSNGLIFTRADLPPESEWDTVLPAAMGSPDEYGRQLNGMGSGISSTSKVIVLGPPTRPDVDVDYTFVQVGIKDGKLDKAGNCGNLSSLTGPVAWDMGMVERNGVVSQDEAGVKWATVRVFNTNTSKVLETKFRLEGEPGRFCPVGDYTMDGVPGTGSKITLSFLSPAGAKTGKALPTGSFIDSLQLQDGREIKASLVDVSNPGVFVHAQDILALAQRPNDVQAALSLNPPAIEADEDLKNVLASVRAAGALKMGLDPNVESVPKIVMLLPSASSDGVDIKCLAMSMGQAHKAVPLTLALCLGAACQIPGTIASEIVAEGRGLSKTGEEGKQEDEAARIVTIGHASGKVDVGISMRDGEIVSAELLRTARVMMKGEVLY